MKRFLLVRHEDVSGVSGTGIVAEGVVFKDGRVAMRWLTNDIHAIVIHESVEHLTEIHGHGGKTELQWVDDVDAAEKAAAETAAIKQEVHAACNQAARQKWVCWGSLIAGSLLFALASEYPVLTCRFSSGVLFTAMGVTAVMWLGMLALCLRKKK